MEREKLLLALLILAIWTPTFVAINEEIKNTFRFLLNFYKAPVADLIRNSTAQEDKPKEPGEEDNTKRQQMPTPSLSPTFKVSTKTFPVDPYMANVVFQLFGKDGILEKGGFTRSGYILRSASASLVLLKSFRNRTVLLHEALRGKQAPITDGVFAVVIQLFFSSSDYSHFVDWLRQGVKSGYENYDDPCSPMVAIKFMCCTPTASALLAPQFGTLRVDVD